MTTRRAKREFTEEFKKQMVQLYSSGKRRADIVQEYDLTASALNNWIKRMSATGSTKERDNRTPRSRSCLS